MMKESKIRLHLRFSGRVQGVGFRWTAVNASQMLDLTGWVENQSDGSVEMEVQGEEPDIRRLIDTLRRGRYIDIQKIDRFAMPLAEHEYGFRERGW